MSPTGIPTVSRAANQYTCEEPFGQWGHDIRIERGSLYVRLASPPGESATGDPFDLAGWSAVRMCLECAQELPRPQYNDVCWQVARRWSAHIFDIPLSMLGKSKRPKDKDYVLPTQTLLRMVEVMN